MPPGAYIVAITAANFTGVGRLVNMISSRSIAPNPIAGDNQVDNNDNGRDVLIGGIGIISSRIRLALGSESTIETPVNDPVDGVGGSGTDGERNEDSDLTVDFGFYIPMSLGNRVWLDDSNNPANAATRNNGALDLGTDDLDNPNTALVDPLGAVGVTLRLYRDLDADGVIDAGEDTGRTTTTNATGYYLFDGLTRASYIVGVEAGNFAAAGPLNGFYSSVNAAMSTDNNIDSTDDGFGQAAAPQVPDPGFGVSSPSIALNYTTTVIGDEPTSGIGLHDEIDPAVQLQTNRGANGEPDAFSNLTIDFGFVRPPRSIGNRIWLDGDDSGTINSGETGIPGIMVDLYLDADGDGTPDRAAIRTDLTDANGYYLFDNLISQNYLVQVTPDNFAAGGVLRGLSSSTGVNNDQVTDSNDNGIDNANPAANGIFSDTILLAAGAMPLLETDLSGNAADGTIGQSRGVNGERDEHSNLTIDFGFSMCFDLGDAPDSYGTTYAAGGPNHVLVGNLFMGINVDDEGDGQDSVGADGDDINGAAGDDEDGVTIPPVTAGTNLNVEVVVFNNTGSSATLIGWVDVDGSGTFDPAEGLATTVPSSATPQTVILTLPIPNTADGDTGGATYARFRLTTDPTVTQPHPAARSMMARLKIMS